MVPPNVSYIPTVINLKKTPKHWIQFELKGLPKNYFWRGMFMNARSRNCVGFICGGGGRYKMGFFRACCSCPYAWEAQMCHFTCLVKYRCWSTGHSGLYPALDSEEQRAARIEERKWWTRTGMSSFFSKEPGKMHSLFILAHYLFEAAFCQFQKREIYADAELEIQAGWHF